MADCYETLKSPDFALKLMEKAMECRHPVRILKKFAAPNPGGLR